MAAKLVHNYTANGSSTTDEYGSQLILNRIVSGEVVEGFNVVANGTPNMTVKVNPGSGRIPTGTYPASYGYLISHDTAAGESVTISAAAASPRIDYIVAYVDKSVAGSTSPANVNNTNNVLKFVAVAGTPAASPSVPTTLQIQTAIGASNPYSIYAQIAVGANVTSVVNGNITDKRVMAVTSIPVADGSVTTAKLANAAVTAAKVDWTSFAAYPAFKVYRAAALNSSNVGAVVAFDTKVFDLGADVDVVTNKGRFTARYTGIYHFSGSAGNTVATSTAMYCQFKVNGTIVSTGSLAISTSAPNYSHISTTLRLSAGDYVELSFVGGNGSVMGVGMELCWFSGHQVFRIA